MEFQSEGSRLGLSEGWWEGDNVNVNWKGVAAHRVAAADSEPAERRRWLLERMGRVTFHLQFEERSVLG